MRFKSEKQPPRGTSKIRRSFLILPMKIGVETRWLETAYWEEVYFGWRWNPIKWVDGNKVHDVGQSFS